jgi:phosphopantothenoylcysteine synthetase/decarboxylase
MSPIFDKLLDQVVRGSLFCQNVRHLSHGLPLNRELVLFVALAKVGEIPDVEFESALLTDVNADDDNDDDGDDGDDDDDDDDDNDDDDENVDDDSDGEGTSWGPLAW